MANLFTYFDGAPYLLVPPFKNVFQHTFISVNNRSRAPSKYVNKLAIGFYFFIPKVKQYFCAIFFIHLKPRVESFWGVLSCQS
jgi:hypothetical protein